MAHTMAHTRRTNNLFSLPSGPDCDPVVVLVNPRIVLPSPVVDPLPPQTPLKCHLGLPDKTLQAGILSIKYVAGLGAEALKVKL